MTRTHEVPTWKKVTASVVAGLGLLSTTACSTESVPANTPAASASATPGETASSETPTDEFTPGATGKFSPEALKDLSDKEVIDRLRIRGETPEEVAASSEQVMTAFLESGATEEELAPYLPLNDDSIKRFVTDMDEKYSALAAKAWNGTDTLNESTRIAHRIMLDAYASNHLFGQPMPDFQIGTTDIIETTITEGSFKSGNFSLSVTYNCSSNYDTSIMSKLGEGDDGHTYRSILNVVGEHTSSTSYSRVGDHYMTTSA